MLDGFETPQDSFISLEIDPALVYIPPELEIVRIEGRWAQVISGSTYVKYLSDPQSPVSISWEDWKLVKLYTSDVVVARFLEIDRNAFDDSELSAIHWGAEQKENPELKKQVHVFGAFEKKA